jgi:hypothetical protein
LKMSMCLCNCSFSSRWFRAPTTCERNNLVPAGRD